MASVAGPNTENLLIEILKANGIDPNMNIDRDDLEVKFVVGLKFLG